MENSEIIKLYWARNEQAVEETKKKYGIWLTGLAINIVKSHEDAEECVNDTYLAAWNSIPPNKPNYLFAYLARITRNFSYNLLNYHKADKRHALVVELSQELENCITSPRDETCVYESREIAKTISDFLRTLPKEQCAVFMRRYWYSDSIALISNQFNMSESKVKSMLFRIRNKLKKYLKKEGISL